LTGIIKFENKKLDYSFVQGRFSTEVAGKFQHFPIHNWENEFGLAKKLNFNSVEWIITDFSNPIFNPLFSKIIKKTLKKHSIKISSISMDLIMDNPLHKLSKKESIWLGNKLLLAINFFKIKRISIPIEERCRFNNQIEKMIALKNLHLITYELKKKCKICIETDMSPESLVNILNMKKFNKLGILLDLGNTRAHGFYIEDYFRLFKDRIYSIHIKYRDRSYGKTKVLNKNNFHELKFLKKNLDLFTNLGDISFQTFKTNSNFFLDMKKSIKNFNNYVK
jgi:hypothetical protein